MSTLNIVMLVVIVVMTVLAALFALAETSITRMTRSRAVALAQSQPKAGGRVLRIVENLERDLNSIYLSVNIVQTIQAALVGVLAADLFGAAGVAIGILINVLVLFVIAEAAPKTWALQHTERAAMFTAPVVEFAGWVLRLPARALIGVANIILPGKGLKKGPFVTEEEILALAEEAMEHAVIEESERDLIESIIDFGDTVVREIMVPRTDMVMIGASSTVAECVDRAIDKGMSRIPVYGESHDDIEGIVYVKDAMRAEREGGAERCVQELIRPAMFVPENKRVAELLAEMQARRTHMAVVVDEYGGTAGLATLEDLLEELVGEITDEFDEEVADVEQLPNGDALVNATLNVDDVNEELDLELPEGNYDSLGGLVFELLGRVPVAGDSVEVPEAGVRIIVERLDGRRVVRVRLVRVEPSELADAEESA
jgi:CBS domain containing-hemolysin-like protein